MLSRWFGPPEPLPAIPPVEPPQQTDGLLAAKRAQNAARRGLLDAVDSGVESRDMAGRMRELRVRNHFGPLIEDAFREQPRAD